MDSSESRETYSWEKPHAFVSSTTRSSTWFSENIGGGGNPLTLAAGRREKEPFGNTPDHSILNQVSNSLKCWGLMRAYPM